MPNVCTSPFVVGSYKKVPLPKRAPTNDYVSKKIVLKTVITGYQDDDKQTPIGVMVPTVVEEKTNIKELINSHANEVGVANVIRRILATGDMSLLEQNKAQYIDTTTLPKSISDVQAKALALESIYANIPAELKKDMTLSEFVKTMTDDRIVEYYKAKAAEEKTNVSGGEE